MASEAGFAVKVSMADCPAQLLVNGIPVLSNDDAHRIDATVPVTEFVVPGVNSLAWELLLESGRLPPEARARATWTGGPKTSGERHELFSVELVGADPGSTISPTEQSRAGLVSASQFTVDPSTDIGVLERRIDLAIPVPRWRWVGAPAIPDTPETLESLTRFYGYLLDLLEKQQRDQLVELHAEKVTELAMAYGLSNEEALAEVMLPDICRDPEWRLLRAAPARLFVDTAAGGRLARLLHPNSGPLIVYRSEDGLYQTFDIWLRSGETGWTLAR